MVRTDHARMWVVLSAALLAAGLLALALSQAAFSQEKGGKPPASSEVVTPQVAGTPQVITSEGPLTRLVITDELNCQVNHATDGDSREFYPNDSDVGACGTFLSTGGTLYSPSYVPAGSEAQGTTYTKVSQSAVTGTGTPSDPFKIVTVVDAGTTGLRITQTDSYVVGQQTYRTDVQVANSGPSSQDAILYRAGDCYLQNSDEGFGSFNAATGAVQCRIGVQNSSGQTVPGDRIEEWTPLSPGSSFYQGEYDEVWTKIGAQQPFDNTCARCTQYIDNGAGLSWNVTVPAGGSETRSHQTSVKIDAVGPTARPPVQTFTANTALTSTGGAPVKLAWSATDNGGSVSRYQLQQSVNGGAYADVLASTTATTTTRTLSPNSTYRFRLRAQDNAGNWGAYAYGPTFRVAPYQENSTGVTYPSDAWTRRALTGAYGGYVKYATASGAKARLSFTGTGRNLAWITTKGPNRGQAYVTVDGAAVDANPAVAGTQPFSLYSSTQKVRQVIPIPVNRWLTPGPHSVEIRTASTKTRPRVDVDAFVVLK